MNLKKSVVIQLKTRLEWLHQAEQAARKVDDLPETIKILEGSADCGYDGNLQLCLYDGDEAIRVCKEAGAKFDKPEVNTNAGDFKVKGQLEDVRIKVFSLSVPPECHVEKEAYTAFRYKAICNETEEEVKPGAC